MVRRSHRGPGKPRRPTCFRTIPPRKQVPSLGRGSRAAGAKTSEGECDAILWWIRLGDNAASVRQQKKDRRPRRRRGGRPPRKGRMRITAAERGKAATDARNPEKRPEPCPGFASPGSEVQEADRSP